MVSLIKLWHINNFFSYYFIYFYFFSPVNCNSLVKASALLFRRKRFLLFRQCSQSISQVCPQCAIIWRSLGRNTSDSNMLTDFVCLKQSVLLWCNPQTWGHRFMLYCPKLLNKTHTFIFSDVYGACFIFAYIVRWDACYCHEWKNAVELSTCDQVITKTTCRLPRANRTCLVLFWS